MSSSNYNLAVASTNILSLFSISSSNEVELSYNHVSHVNSEILDMQWNHNNMVIVCAWMNGIISLTPAKNPNTKMDDIVQGDIPIMSICMSSGSRYLTTAASNNLSIWDLKTKQVIKQLRGHNSDIRKVIFNESDRFLFSGGSDGTILFHDANSSQIAQTYEMQNAITDLKISPLKKNLFASADAGGVVKLWDIVSRREVYDGSFLNSGHAPNPCIGIEFCSKNDQLFISAGDDTNVYMWDIGARRKAHSINLSSLSQSVGINEIKKVTSMSFLGDGKNLSVGTSNGYVFLFDIRYPDVPYHIIHASMEPITCVRFQNTNRKQKSRSSELSEQATSEIRSKVEPSIIKSHRINDLAPVPKPQASAPGLNSESSRMNHQHNFSHQISENSTQTNHIHQRSPIKNETISNNFSVDRVESIRNENNWDSVSKLNSGRNLKQTSDLVTDLSKRSFQLLNSDQQTLNSAPVLSASKSPTSSIIHSTNKSMSESLSQELGDRTNLQYTHDSLNSLRTAPQSQLHTGNGGTLNSEVNINYDITNQVNNRGIPTVRSRSQELSRSEEKLGSTPRKSHLNLNENIIGDNSGEKRKEHTKHENSTAALQRNSSTSVSSSSKSQENGLRSSIDKNMAALSKDLGKQETSTQLLSPIRSLSTYPSEKEQSKSESKFNLQLLQLANSQSFQDYFDSKFQDIKQTFHKEMRAYHTELIKQFQQQQEDIEEKLAQSMEQMQEVLKENRLLKQEVERLKSFQY